MIIQVVILLVAVRSACNNEIASSRTDPTSQQPQHALRSSGSSRPINGDKDLDSISERSFLPPSSLYQHNSSSSLLSSRRVAHQFPARGRQFRQAYEASRSQLFGLTSRPSRHIRGTHHQLLADTVPPFMTDLYQQIVADTDDYDGLFPVPVEVGVRNPVVVNSRERSQLRRYRKRKLDRLSPAGRRKRHSHLTRVTNVNTVRSFIGKQRVVYFLCDC